MNMRKGVEGKRERETQREVFMSLDDSLPNAH